MSIHTTIQDKYGIDINQDNIFKLFKIDTINISDDEINEKIEQTKKRWLSSINGANEKNAARDKARLEKIDKYSAILKDKKLRTEIFNYYSGATESDKTRDNIPSNLNGVEFARSFFKLVQTSKKVKKEDVDFFFDYYQSQRKYKKDIYEMLATEFKIPTLKKGEDVSDKYEEEIIDGKEKTEKKQLIVNLFSKATVLKINRCIQNYELAKKSKEVLDKYSDIDAGLYVFLRLEKIKTIEEFQEKVSQKSKEVYGVRQEKGTAFTPLVDAINILIDISKYSDVIDNFYEFKLLVKYPELTPYMYEFISVRNETFKGIYNIASKEYSFRNEDDFVLNYFNPVHDNFNIDISGIRAIIKKAEKNANVNRVINVIDSKLGFNKDSNVPLTVLIVHFMAYWPIFILYLIFEIFKTIATKLKVLSIPTFLLVLFFSNKIIPSFTKYENLLFLRNIIDKEVWCEYILRFKDTSIEGPWETVMISISIIIVTVLIYVLPALCSAWITYVASGSLMKRYDWIGLERTLKNILSSANKYNNQLFKQNPKMFWKKNIASILIGIANIALIIIAAMLLIHMQQT